ncbi:MAG: trigger factor, partial [Acidimicrobiia bacterium]
LREAVPVFYSRAISEEDVPAVSLPEIEVTRFEQGEPLHFTATVDVRPEVTLPEYKGIEVTRPEIAPTDEEVDDQLERLRERFGTLEPIGRNATKGDYATIDLIAYRHDQKIDDASATDLVYEVGSGAFVSELDAELDGKRTGDILKFNATLPEGTGELGGQEVAFSVVVKEVQTKRLPALDDEFAKTASEFETLDELKAEVRTRLETVMAASADSEVRSKVLEDLVERTEIEVPESMIAHETEHRLTRLLADLQRANLTLAQYLEGTGTTQEELLTRYREASEKSVAAQLVLEAVSQAEQVNVSSEEIDEEINRLSEALGRPADEVRRDLEEANQVQNLAGDILRRKTLDFLVEQAKVVQA